MWRALWLGLLVLLGGCGINQDDYQANQPKLDLATFFDGRVYAWGAVHDRSGAQTRRFKVVIDASWQGNQGELDEHFIFDDGERSRRVWQITKNGDSYTGTAADVIGQAKGRVVGNSLNWRYTLRLPVDDTSYDIDFDDWMYQFDEQTLFNRAEMTKFGFKVGEILLFFSKGDAESLIQQPFP